MTTPADRAAYHATSTHPSLALRFLLEEYRDAKAALSVRRPGAPMPTAVATLRAEWRPVVVAAAERAIAAAQELIAAGGEARYAAQERLIDAQADLRAWSR